MSESDELLDEIDRQLNEIIEREISHPDEWHLLHILRRGLLNIRADILGIEIDSKVYQLEDQLDKLVGRIEELQGKR